MTAARSAVGKVDCPHCGQSADVCKNKSDKLYYRCARCGIGNMHGAQFQEWILENATFFDRAPPAKDPAPRKPPAEKKPAPKPAKQPIADDDDDEQDDALESGDRELGRDTDDEFARDLGL